MSLIGWLFLGVRTLAQAREDLTACARDLVRPLMDEETTRFLARATPQVRRGLGAAQLTACEDDQAG